MDVDVKVKEMMFTLSPSILTTIIKITDDLTGNQIIQEKPRTIQKDSSFVDWHPKPISRDELIAASEESYLTVEESGVPVTSSTEKLVIVFDMIELMLGNDLEGMVIPLIMSRFGARIHLIDWTGMMKFEGDFTTDISYYHDKLGAWEPLLEPNVVNESVAPYEINIRMFYGDSEKLDFSSKFLYGDNTQEHNIDEDEEPDAPVILDDARKALFFIISSEDEMQLTFTEKTIEITKHLVEAWSFSLLRNSEKTELVPPFQFESQLGVPLTVWLEAAVKASIPEKSNPVKIQPKFINHQPSNKDHRSLSSVTALGSHHVLSSVFPSTSDFDTIDGQDSNPWLINKKSQKDYIDIEVQGFNPVRHISLKKAGMFLYSLLPPKNGCIYQLGVGIEIVNGRRNVYFGSNIELFNDLCEPVEIYTERQKEMSLVLDVTERSRISLPLSDSLAEILKVKSGGMMCQEVIKTKEITSDENSFVITCQENKEDERKRYILVVTSSKKCDQKLQAPAPLRSIHLLPPVQIISYLPNAVEIQLQVLEVKSDLYYVNPGTTSDVLDLQLKEETFHISIKYENELGIVWEGNAHCKRRNKDVNRVIMKRKEKKDGDMVFEVDAEINFNRVFMLTIYSAFWLVNKTGLELQFKNSDGNDYLLESTDDCKPNLIAYSNKKKAKGNLKVIEGSWSESFSLNAIGDESFITCETKDGSKYVVYISIQLSNTGLSNLITLSPRYMIMNHTQIDLMFAEVNSMKESLANTTIWSPLLAMKCSALWLSSSQIMLLLKEKDSAYVGPAIPFDKDYKIAKRLSNSQTLCIDINRIGERLIMNISGYEEGCIPLRVDNYCNMPIFLKQKEVESLNSISEFPPNTARYFNWSEFNKPYELVAMFLGPTSFERSVDVSIDSWGKVSLQYTDTVDERRSSGRHSCLACTRICSCFPCCCNENDDEEDRSNLLVIPASTSASPDQLIYWISYLEGTQRVLAFTSDVAIARKLHQSGDLEYVTMEVFLSLQGLGLSLLNSGPVEIVYASLTGGTSLWEVETGKDVWEILDVDISTFLEDSWKNSALNASYENKIQVDLQNMVMKKPKNGQLRRSCDPALWLQYSQSKSNQSVHMKLHRLQIDDQQYDVIYPSVFYPTPLPPRVLKRNGVKPFLEFSMVFSSLYDVMIIKYLKILLQEINLKIDRSILTGLMSLFRSEIMEAKPQCLFEEDIKITNNSIQASINAILESQSLKMLIGYFHLSPVKIHLSFTLEGQTGVSSSSEEELLEWFISTVGIHFTDISDAVIKLGFFERKNVSITQDMLLADASKHYTLQAIKQFHVLVLGLDVLGNPYGLLTEYGQGFKDLFYEPYLGSVQGPHQFAQGLGYGIKSLLGHTIGGTAGAASLITDQLGQVVAALSFDSEYKRRRKRELMQDPAGIGEGLAIGGKQFLLGLVFGISGLVTKPVQGARQGGIEGFFKGVGKGILGLLVKPTGGVIDLVTSSLDGVRRFAEQGGEDIVCRMRLPRLTYPKETVSVYSSEKSYGYGLLRTLRTKRTIDGLYKDHLAIPEKQPTIVLFTTEVIVEATQRKFFGDWQIEWLTYYKLLKGIESQDDVVRFDFKFTVEAKNKASISHSTFHEIKCVRPRVSEILHDKASSYMEMYITQNTK